MHGAETAPFFLAGGRLKRKFIRKYLNKNVCLYFCTLQQTFKRKNQGHHWLFIIEIEVSRQKYLAVLCWNN